MLNANLSANKQINGCEKQTLIPRASLINTKRNIKNKHIDHCQKQTLMLRKIIDEQLYVLTKSACFYQYLDHFLLDCLETFTKWG